jgi:hypothetical protein
MRAWRERALRVAPGGRVYQTLQTLGLTIFCPALHE